MACSRLCSRKDAGVSLDVYRLTYLIRIKLSHDASDDPFHIYSDHRLEDFTVYKGLSFCISDKNKAFVANKTTKNDLFPLLQNHITKPKIRYGG